jgi:hypothetical protein
MRKLDVGPTHGLVLAEITGRYRSPESKQRAMHFVRAHCDNSLVFPSFPRLAPHRAKRLWTGAGGVVPLIAIQSMSFNSRSSAISEALKSSFIERSARSVCGGFLSFSGTCGGC